MSNDRAATRIVIDRPGGYDRLRLETFAPAPPGPGEVRIDVTAIGVNYADCLVRMGLYESAKKYVGWPITPGFDFAGRIVARGPDVDVALGADVLGVTRFGAYASSVTVPARQVFARPDGLSDAAGAALPTAALTAWYAVNELATPPAGSAVLVHSAAGGVGGMLVALCRARGCRVLAAVGGRHKVPVAEGHGADRVVCSADEDLWSTARTFAPDGFRAVFDANGPSTLKQSYRSLAPQGRLIVYGFHSMLPRRGGRARFLRLARDYLKIPRFHPMDLTARNRAVLGFNLSYLFDEATLLARGMREVLEALKRSELATPPIREISLAAVADAHRALESGTTVGKIVLRP